MVTITSLSRKSYTIKHKRMTVRAVTAMVEAGTTISSACNLASVERRQYYRWKRVVLGEKDTHPKKAKATQATSVSAITEPVDQDMNPGITGVASTVMYTKLLLGNLRSLHEGRISILAHIENDVMRFLFEYREQGIQVTTKMVRKFVEMLMPDFRLKSKCNEDACIRRFLRQAGYTHRLSTHTAQKKPEETKAAASEFMEYMRRKVEKMCPDHVLNMDQTPIPFSFHSKRTWEKMGARTVHVLASTGETKRATLAATVTMSGELLPPLLIFKGSKNGRIDKNELPTFPQMGFYAVQKKAWMDESMMDVWIEKCLSPWKDTLPLDATPLLILDSFRVHMMGPVVEKIQRLGIEVQHIPGGCTYLCQPIDVGVNRPVKSALEDKWEDWIDAENLSDGNAMTTPSRELIATWVVEAYWMLHTEISKNAWKKKDFEWTL